jgi:ribosome modulation factor
MNLQEKVDQAYQEGKDAYFDGKKSENNPYTGVDEDHQWEAWNEGYNNAAWDD